MTQVCFVSRSDLVRSLHARIQGLTAAIGAAESEIRQAQYEQAIRADLTQTRQNGFPHPHSKQGRDGIRGCRDRLRRLRQSVSDLTAQRSSLRKDVSFEENIINARIRPPRTKTPMRKF